VPDEAVPAAIHTDRRRAHSFGDDATRYDRARPSYPAELIDDLVAGGGRDGLDILDVGCGTGIVARLFTARGGRVLRIEADARMAEVARSHGVTVEVAPFEAWERAGRSFDLVVSGQAWHWIDPAVGPSLAADCLRPGGRFAAFWNDVHHRPDAARAFARVYGEAAPELLRTSVALGGPRGPERSRRDPALEVLGATGAFTEVTRWRYTWERSYLVADWLAYLVTVSDHHVLPEAQRAVLLAAVGEALTEQGDSLTVDYVTRVVTGVLR
jgi:SAM-dependent methyltransferase